MRALARFHDVLTTISAWLSATCVATIAFSYCYEVVSRYVFNSPTAWVGAVTVYLLLMTVMLMFPMVTRERGHVTITYILDNVGPSAARWLVFVCIAVSAVMCGLSVWFCTTETLRQHASGTMMMDSLYLVPKWWLSAFIVYGFLSSAIYFLRQMPGALAGEGAPAASLEGH